MPDWREEIEELHRWFEDWLGGRIPADDGGRLEVALAPAFTLVTPGGDERSRFEVIDAVRKARAARPGLRIRIRDPRLLAVEGELVAVSYEEWQESGGEPRGRLSTALLRRRGPDAGLEWLRVHETWITPAPPPP
ncbi:MAG: DUF4440 domain-containing protein [Gemmatimonadota bacterium]|nr:DUF4440 domain-containing protein [Gemmatimonadota bacterium]